MLIKDSLTDVFQKLQNSADGPIPADQEQRKLIFCNAKGVTHLANNEIIPTGNQRGKPVCKWSEA